MNRRFISVSAEQILLPEKQPCCLPANAPSRKSGDSTAGLFYLATREEALKAKLEEAGAKVTLK